MERAQYMRFKKDLSPMSPGRGGGEITKAMIVLDKKNPPTCASNELMHEILVGDHWVALRKLVKGTDGKSYMATRVLPRDSVRDYEPFEERSKKQETAE